MAVLFRVGIPGQPPRLARGDPAGPVELLPPELTLDGLLSRPAGALSDALESAPATEPVPPDARVLAPVESQEVWAAGVTYVRSRDARVEESREPTIYDRVYEADRPELFFKSAGWRVRGPGEAIAVRADSGWNVPEPELTLVLASDLGLAGFTIGNDVSSRTIEGENPLYLPQAKVYDGACAIGPGIVPAGTASEPFGIGLEIRRAGETIVDLATSTDRINRSFEELASHLGSALTFPVGVLLLTGTGLVPDPPFTLLPGDQVRISIEGLGVLENAVEVVGRTVAARARASSVPPS